MKLKILIIDDDEEIRTQMKWAVANEYEVFLAGNRVEAIRLFQEHCPQVVLLDLGLPPNPNSTLEGMATLANLLMIDRFAKVIIISGQSDHQNAVSAIGAGAYDFLAKPVNLEPLRILLQRAIFVRSLEEDYQDTKNKSNSSLFEGILGQDASMKEVFKTVDKVAKASVPVLILGESGTGKELVANAIHRRSNYKDKPFIAINCNAIPESLIESELFGYEKGAFTGAISQRIGLIESAAGGTLFLDEIGDLPLLIQVKLLRFLQEKRIQRIGGRHEIEVETRIIAATHVNLNQAILEGRFREDLYFRLAVIVCRLPALRDRGEDIQLLAEDFIVRFGEQCGRSDLKFSGQAMESILAYGWPGNVRELQNRVQRAVIMAEGKFVSSEDLEITGAVTGVHFDSVCVSQKSLIFSGLKD
jgi:two-component system, NtrC family, response regulator